MDYLMFMSMAMATGMIFMTLPRMSPTQYYWAILLSSVQDPKPKTSDFKVFNNFNSNILQVETRVEHVAMCSNLSSPVSCLNVL